MKKNLFSAILWAASAICFIIVFFLELSRDDPYKLTLIVDGVCFGLLLINAIVEFVKYRKGRNKEN